MAEVFGAQCVVLAIDARRRAAGDGYEVVVHGGRTETGREAVEWAREGVERGAGEILLTSMDRDGTEDGYELELTRLVADAVEVPVIASGGAGTLDHLVEAVDEGGADAVLCASIFHYGQYSVGEAKERMDAAGIPVRPGDPTGRELRPALDPRSARARGSALPGMDRLLPALDGLPPAYLVGGAVRDLLRGAAAAGPRPGGGGRRRGRGPRAGRAPGRARPSSTTASARPPCAPAASSSTWPPHARETLRAARARCPRWSPPRSTRTSRRRDFTRERDGRRPARRRTAGALHDPHGGRADLGRAADPRAARPQLPRRPHAAPARAALRGPARVRARAGHRAPGARGRRRRMRSPRSRGRASATSCWTCWREPEAPAAVARMGDLGVAAALHPRPARRPRAGGVRGRWGRRRPGPTRRSPPWPRSCARRPRRSSRSLAGPRAARAAERDAVMRGRAAGAARWPRRCAPSRRPRAARPARRRAARGPGAGPGPRRARGAVLRFLTSLRDVRLEITGDDLLAAGVPASPAIGRALEETLRRKLDGEVSGRDEELRTALELARGGRMSELASSVTCRAPGSVFSTRNGGVSEGPYESLNLGILTDDEPGAGGREPRARLAERGRAGPGARGDGVAGARHRDRALARAPPGRRDGYATPGAELPRWTATRPPERDLALLVLVADCLPVALASGGRVAMLHCGWRGARRRHRREGAWSCFDEPPAAAIGPGHRALLLRGGARGARGVRRPRRRGRRAGCSTCARSPSAGCERAGVASVEHVDLCTPCRAGPLLLPPPRRRRHRPPVRRWRG